jgi:hypothetical protein
MGLKLVVCVIWREEEGFDHIGGEKERLWHNRQRGGEAVTLF